MASGVDPINRSFTNTCAPAGRDRTLMLPTPDVLRTGTGRKEKLVAAVAFCAVNCTRCCSGTYPSRTTRMVYDPSGKLRIVIGVCPLGFPFTVTSAFAGLDRTSKLPSGIGADCGGVGAGVGGAGDGGGFSGSSTVVSATDGFVTAAAGGSAGRAGVFAVIRKYPTINATVIALKRRMGRSGLRLVGCADHDSGSCARGSGSRSGSGTNGLIVRLSTGSTSTKRSSGAASTGSPAWRNAAAKSLARPARARRSCASAAENTFRNAGPCSCSSSSRLASERRRPDIASNAMAASACTSVAPSNPE